MLLAVRETLGNIVSSRSKLFPTVSQRLLQDSKPDSSVNLHHKWRPGSRSMRSRLLVSAVRIPDRLHQAEISVARPRAIPTFTRAVNAYVRRRSAKR
jgi:hypothetical protein